MEDSWATGMVLPCPPVAQISLLGMLLTLLSYDTIHSCFFVCVCVLFFAVFCVCIRGGAGLGWGSGGYFKSRRSTLIEQMALMM